jgi:hypothetical protein
MSFTYTAFGPAMDRALSAPSVDIEVILVDVRLRAADAGATVAMVPHSAGGGWMDLAWTFETEQPEIGELVSAFNEKWSVG